MREGAYMDGFFGLLSIVLAGKDGSNTVYTDVAEIGAGWKKQLQRGGNAAK